jgi:probable phosphoglycerate mutase
MNPVNVPITLYLVRHATPDWSRTDLVYHQPPGPPLTPHGRAEARALGAFLLQAGVKELFASPLERCQRTAAIAAEVAGLPCETRPGLAEIRPDETHAGVLARMWPEVERACLAAGAAGGPVALVTHGGPVDVVLQEMGLDPAARKQMLVFDHHNLVPPAGAWRAEIHQENTADCRGAWRLELAFKPENIGSLI